MERVEKIVVVDRPVRVVYDQWTRFAQYPDFVPGLMEVRQLDSTHLRCRAELQGRWSEWDNLITDQRQDRALTWKSISGAQSAGTLRFESLPGGERTQVRLIIAWDSVRVPFGAVEVRASEAMDRFKQYIESGDAPLPGWRAEVDPAAAHVQVQTL